MCMYYGIQSEYHIWRGTAFPRAGVELCGMSEGQEEYGGRRRAPDVFTVIGDPTKRKILEMTREREWCVNELVESLALSQPAISKHLRSLREANLVEVRVDGQRRWYRLREDQMGPLQDWMSHFAENPTAGRGATANGSVASAAMPAR